MTKVNLVTILAILAAIFVLVIDAKAASATGDVKILKFNQIQDETSYKFEWVLSDVHFKSWTLIVLLCLTKIREQWWPEEVRGGRREGGEWRRKHCLWPILVPGTGQPTVHCHVRGRPQRIQAHDHGGVDSNSSERKNSLGVQPEGVDICGLVD